jgi:hypothetical protein
MGLMESAERSGERLVSSAASRHTARIAATVKRVLDSV